MCKFLTGWVGVGWSNRKIVCFIKVATYRWSAVTSFPLSCRELKVFLSSSTNSVSKCSMPYSSSLNSVFVRRTYIVLQDYETSSTHHFNTLDRCINNWNLRCVSSSRAGQRLRIAEELLNFYSGFQRAQRNTLINSKFILLCSPLSLRAELEFWYSHVRFRNCVL